MAVDHDFERSIYRQPDRVPAKDDLFTTFADRVLRRVEEVLDGRFCQFPPSRQEIALLRLLRTRQGKDQATSLGNLCEAMKITPRAAKELVHTLRLHFGVQIGASRESESGGYYLIAMQAEALESTSQMWKQAVDMLRVVRQMRRGHQEIDEMLTQLNLELTTGGARDADA